MEQLDPTAQRNLVNSHIAALEAEATAQRLAAAARAGDPKRPDTGAGNPA